MKRFSGLFLFSMVVMGLVAACDGKTITTPPVSSSSQETLDARVIERSPIVLVLVVDDAATTEAAELRARVADTVRAGLLSEREQRWGSSCGNPDPAAWHPGDMRVILARPSAPDGEALLTPIEIPKLAWTTKVSTTEEIDLVASATAEALKKRLAGAGETYRPLHAAKRALDLVSGARPPESDGEAAFVASLPPDLLARLLLVSSRDDNDVANIASLAPAPGSPYTPSWNEVVGPFTASNGTCEADGKGKTRLEAWGKQAEAHLTAWPCDDEPRLTDLLYFGSADCIPECYDHRLPVAPDGTTDCRVFVDQHNVDPCDPERGHHDPDGKPEIVDHHGLWRRCEVDELTGAALDACRSTLACSGCQSGFCATEVPELSHDEFCHDGTHVWPLRFTGEAIGAGSEWIHIVCNVGSPGR